MDRTTKTTLSVQDLLAGSSVIHDVKIPPEVLSPGQSVQNDAGAHLVKIKPLTIATLTLIARGARDDQSLVPLLMVKEALVEPKLTFEEIRQMHAGLIHFLIRRINWVSGLSIDGESWQEITSSPISQTHLLLAKHFGWTPEQVSQLTPAQVAVYLAGIEKFIQLAAQK